MARKRDEAKCGRGKTAKACLASVAAKYEAPALPLTAALIEQVAIAPLVPAGAPAESRAVSMPGSPTPPPPAKPLEMLQAGTPAPAAVASAPAPAPQPAAPPVAAATLPVARDEQQRRPRAADAVNDLQIGPQSLILDRLQARGEIVPGGVQLDFGYRLAIDEATAAHHLFSLGISSARCAADPCGLRWFARGGTSAPPTRRA